MSTAPPSWLIWITLGTHSYTSLLSTHQKYCGSSWSCWPKFRVVQVRCRYSTHRETKRGKLTAHDSNIPHERKNSFHSISVKIRITQGVVRWYMGINGACTQAQVHNSSSKTPAKHSCESHLCHVYESVCWTDGRVQYVWLTGDEQSTGAEPYLAATMPSQGPEQETLERGRNSQGMPNISQVGRHSAWWYTHKHMRRKRLVH